MQSGQGDGASATRQPDPVGHLRDGAHLRVLVLVLWDEQDTVLVTDVDGESDVHVREDDEVV